MSDDEFDNNAIAMPDTEWTRMQVTVNEITRQHVTSFVEKYREEFRCTEETAIRIKEANRASPNLAETWASFAVGIPVLVSEDVPMGKLQFWRGDTMVKEIDVK